MSTYTYDLLSNTYFLFRLASIL